MERDARLQSLFCISFRVPSKEALPPGSLHRAPTERDTTPPEPLSTINQSRQSMNPFQVAQLSPHKVGYPSPEPSLIPFRDPSKGAPPPGSLTELP